MKNTPIWKPVSILLVVALSVLAIYSYGLRPGLDLAGGTTLVYEVDVPEDQDAATVIEQTIDVLRDRVDPAGVRNLVWRAQAGNRIEIQMALPEKDTVERRETFVRLRREIFEENITPQQLDAVLRAAPESRPALLQTLAGTSETRQALAQDLLDTHAALNAAKQPYQEAQDARRKAQQELAQLAGDAPQETRTALQEELAQRQAELIEKTRAFIEARRAHADARQALLATNINPAEVERVLDLSNTRSAGEEPTKTLREQALEELIAEHPQRAQQIKDLAQAWEAYEAVKGPLDDPNDLIALLRGSGVLEFRIAAPAGLPNLADYRQQLAERGPRAGLNRDYRWFKIDDITSFADRVTDRQRLTQDPQAYFEGRGMVGQEYGGDYYLLLANFPGASLTRAIEGWELTSASRSIDDMGFLAISFRLNTLGAELMSELTGKNMKRPMAIVLDNKVMSAPTINGRISGSGIITGGSGGFSPAELQYLLRTLNAGSLQARVSEDPISINTTGPQFGADNLESGVRAVVIALLIVCVFMAVYYFFWGMLANFALVTNIFIILGVMALLEATFTLPGIAGIVLTIGMAVDANVLIFERIREEFERQADLPTAVRLGFEKALSTIIDSNMTTLITCLVLGYTATADVRGFAVTLGIGLIANVFTAVFASHVIVNLVVDNARPKKLPMMPMVVPAIRRLLSPNIDWLAHKGKFIALSITLMVAGIAGIVSRGQDLLDIEFRSGTQVAFELAPGETLTIPQVRDRLDQVSQQQNLPNLAGDKVTVVTVGNVDGAEAHEFSIATLNTDASQVSEAIKTAFADVLNVERPLHFEGQDAQSVGEAPVYPLRTSNLGDAIGRPAVTEEVGEYVGGVAVVIDNMTPAESIPAITKRIERMRMQSTYEAYGFRQFKVVGLELAPVSESAESSEPQYSAVAVVTRDANTNYSENPDAFTEPEGLAATEWNLVRDAMLRDTSLGSVSNFSSQVSGTMRDQALSAIVLSWLAIMIYIWFRFGSLRYGFGAILALIHDVTIAIGLLALAGYIAETAVGRALLLTHFRINLAVIAAAMTLIGYSVNDTIVVFDRIRENRGRMSHVNRGIINDSLNQTLSRTVLTVITTLLAVLALYIFGGPGVHGFAFIMIVGCIVGTYSSVAVATPLLLIGLEGEKKREIKNTPTTTPGTEG